MMNRVHRQMTAQWRRIMVRMAMLAAIVGVASCQPYDHLHGQLPRPYQLELLVVDESTRSDVVEILGSPSTLANFDENTWYYMGIKTRRWAFLDEEILEMRVHALTFNEQDILVSHLEYDENDLRQINFSTDETPTSGRDLTIIQQILGNFGRFNQTGSN
ncbi:MAG: outer membrane protein assembly factor BamE [Pseudomonadota bacterium]